MTSETAEFPWAAGSATGVGSMPGSDPLQAARTVFDELPELPYLPELPGRGPGADLIGRTAGLLTDLPAEITPGGWRLAARPGRDLRRAHDLLDHDLDTLEEVAQGYAGPLKVQAAGPWTLAASLELPASQEPALTDHGAVADLTQSLAEGIAAHVREVGRRVPGATVLLQLDEPSLPAVLAGAVPSASGLRRLAPVEAGPAADGLRAIVQAASAYSIVHCCAVSAPYKIILQSGARGISLDLSLLRPEDEDPFAEAVEAGAGVLAGGIQGVDAGRPEPRELARLITGVWRRIGLSLARCTGQVVITPACGLAGASPERATAVLAACREAARILPELIEEESP
ncbi:MAG TPA: methionine synthase [Streptosporangiaceae bacterium]|nr:methionine synthase [Streptosporangiaceae bacterium]